MRIVYLMAFLLCIIAVGAVLALRPMAFNTCSRIKGGSSVDKAFVVEHINHGVSDLEAVFTARADAQSYADWYNAMRRGEQKRTHEWLIVECPLNPQAQ